MDSSGGINQQKRSHKKLKPYVQTASLSIMKCFKCITPYSVYPYNYFLNSYHTKVIKFLNFNELNRQAQGTDTIFIGYQILKLTKPSPLMAIIKRKKVLNSISNP